MGELERGVGFGFADADKTFNHVVHKRRKHGTVDLAGLAVPDGVDVCTVCRNVGNVDGHVLTKGFDFVCEFSAIRIESGLKSDNGALQALSLVLENGDA